MKKIKIVYTCSTQYINTCTYKRIRMTVCLSAFSASIFEKQTEPNTFREDLLPKKSILFIQETTIKIQYTSPKLLSQRIRKRHYNTLGASVINSLMSSPFLPFMTI